MLLNKIVIFAQFARLCHIHNIKIICLRLSHELLDPQCASSLLGPSRASCDPRFRFTLLLLIHILGAFSCALRSPFLRLVYCFNSFSARCRSVSLGRVARSFASDVFAVGISCRSSGFSWPFTRSDLPRDDVAPGLRWRLLSSFGCYWPFTISDS